MRKSWLLICSVVSLNPTVDRQRLWRKAEQTSQGTTDRQDSRQAWKRHDATEEARGRKRFSCDASTNQRCTEREREQKQKQTHDDGNDDDNDSTNTKSNDVDTCAQSGLTLLLLLLLLLFTPRLVSCSFLAIEADRSVSVRPLYDSDSGSVGTVTIYKHNDREREHQFNTHLDTHTHTHTHTHTLP